MSMYSELLGGLCADVDPLPLPNSRDELVVILLQCRRRLNGHSAAERVMAATGHAEHQQHQQNSASRSEESR